MAEDTQRVRILAAGDPNWALVEAEAIAAGLPFPLPSRDTWSCAHGTDARLVAVLDPAGRVRAAVAAEVSPTRALPGHRLLRVQHAGAALAGTQGEALIRALRQLADDEPRILRLNVEVVLRSTEEHARVAGWMRAAGFTRLEQIRHYHDTLIVDLGGSEAQILASFSTTTRRDLRGWTEHPVEMRPIADARYSSRLNDLARETFERTGGDWQPRPWEARIALCTAEPKASRLVGLFRAGRDDPDALLAYAWGCAHGEHAHYDDAGSTRVDDIKVSMMYPLMWDLIRWAKAQGCTWFDLGGAVPADAKDDPRLGISDFKRRFSKEFATVGAEYQYEPRPLRAAAARVLRDTISRLRR